MNNFPQNYLDDPLNDEALLLTPHEGERLVMNGNELTFKITSAQSNGQFGLYFLTIAPEAIGAKPHYYRYLDETFVVQQGT